MNVLTTLPDKGSIGTVLQQNSETAQIKNYFEKILYLKMSGEEFPVNLDDVWPLAYDRKDSAVKIMERKFIEGIDYQSLGKRAKNPFGGRPSMEYRISTRCLEFLIARKVLEVFDVYRKVFHGRVEPKPLPTATELAWMVIKSEENIKALQSENGEKDEEIARLTPKARLMERVLEAEGIISVGAAAKVLQLNYGRTKLYETLRGKRLVLKNRYGRNEPMQQYIDQGYFLLKEVEYYKSNGGIGINKVMYVTQKGLGFLAKKLGILLLPLSQSN